MEFMYCVWLLTWQLVTRYNKMSQRWLTIFMGKPHSSCSDCGRCRGSLAWFVFFPPVSVMSSWPGALPVGNSATHTPPLSTRSESRSDLSPGPGFWSVCKEWTGWNAVFVLERWAWLCLPMVTAHNQQAAIHHSLYTHKPTAQIWTHTLLLQPRHSKLGQDEIC